MHVTCDLSLTSPGFCIELNGKYTLLCFAQRAREQVGTHVLNSNVKVHILPRIPDSSHADVERYDFICSQVLNVLSPYVDDSILFTIENYAFGKASAHSFKLMELSGVFKYTVHKTFVRSKVRMVTASSWKKLATGKGNSTKHQVLHCVQDKLDIDLCKLFKVNVERTVPNPVQDLADAAGIMFAAKLTSEFNHEN